ncbi:MAG: dephospho-CoA kinase [Actinomycetota bacterium]|nr:dephospho-CoA kinase [Actinomycetota bacterium]
MYLVGLTGGIASGKSTVARFLAERGAVVIDADRLAREVLEPGTKGFDQVVARFGPEVVASDGRLDRERLAEIVFADEQARQDLNAIVHPKVGDRIDERLTALAARDPGHRLVVLDMPLLVEADADPGCQAVVVVTAPEDVRVERLQDRGLTEEEARARIGAQATDEERLRAATHVIDNSGDLQALESQVDRIYAELAAARDEDGS